MRADGPVHAASILGNREAPAVTVVTATLLEASLARLALRGRIPVERVGIGLSAGIPRSGAALVSCGLAGSLSATVEPGAIVIPERVGSVDGSVYQCEPMLVERLHDAAKRLQLRSISASLLTSPTLVVGPERARWAAQGWEAVDMETAVLFALARQVAAVRVVLDSPKHELSPEWQRSWRAALRPRHWMEAARLAPSAASQALLAARVVREAFSPPAAIS